MAQSADEITFRWLAAASAPEDYPMQVVAGALEYHDQDDFLYVPSGAAIDPGWGEYPSIHITGPEFKPLPDKLWIVFYSYLEDQFYEGSFDLPYKEIVRQFREKEAEANATGLNNAQDRMSFRIVVGVAPGGSVAVWVWGRGTTELFFGKADKVDPDFHNAIGVPPGIQRADYIKMVVEFAVPGEVLADIRNKGIDFYKWQNYRRQYRWVPEFLAYSTPEDFLVSFFDGQKGSYRLPLDPDFISTKRTVPKRIEFQAATEAGARGNYYSILFDEDELLSSFAKYVSDDEVIRLEIEPKFPIEQTTIRLKGARESMELKKFVVEKVN